MYYIIDNNIQPVMSNKHHIKSNKEINKIIQFQIFSAVHELWPFSIKINWPNIKHIFPAAVCDKKYFIYPIISMNGAS